MLDDYVVVGLIGPAHGLKGEVYVEPRTDEPEQRFAVGASLSGVRRGETRAFAVERRRVHQGKTLILFAGVTSRTDAESLRGYELRCLPGTGRPADPEEYYDHQLIGLQVQSESGEVVGTLKQIQHHAQDLLVIDTPRGEVLVPFVSALVPVVDLEAGRLVVADRPGLLHPEEG
ncbi:MAG: ribosome maturation factor RimM [Nocardioidaceae bacterium]|nr:ribosome maturation factor RimM [Nocardioidaceae bacterium]